MRKRPGVVSLVVPTMIVEVTGLAEFTWSAIGASGIITLGVSRTSTKVCPRRKIRRRQAWKEGREGDRQARFRVLQTVEREAEEP
jgi:hypothetical protein